jgi:hypothetical protein
MIKRNTQQGRGPVSIFLSYAHEDELLREQLDKHLRFMQRQGLIKMLPFLRLLESFVESLNREVTFLRADHFLLHHP